MDTRKSKFWKRLGNEPERAYRAFECYLTLPNHDRTLLGAYRRHVGNSLAAKPSDTWSRWSGQFAWRERAMAYDDHLTNMRRGAYERGIEEEAERQGALAERTRGRMNELLAVAYEEALKWLETKAHDEMRASDVIQVMRLHLDAIKTLGVVETPKVDEWTEEDDEFIETILKDIEGEADVHEPDEGEEDSEGVEGPQN